MSNPTESRPLNFIEQLIEADIASGRWGTWTAQDAGPGAARLGKPRVHTRFPPEPNGYLHIGHAKSICLNAGLARKYGGKFNLRFDDTNPAKEEQEYVDSIKDDVKWLGGDWEGEFGGGLYWASAFFEQMYAFAQELIKKGKAYVCELPAEEVSKRRGTPQVPATSPFRDRPAEESLRLLAEMRDGKHANGAMTVRARIDLASPNFNLRDPVMYRILHEEHHNTGKTWCIYPMYDWAHGFEDSIEGVTHSICTLEFENHRPLYDWFIGAVNEGRTADGSGPWGKTIHHSQQIEFAKLQLTYTVISKRNLLRMVNEKIVSGWDDPRMPTIRGFRRRGFPAEAIRNFCEEVGATKTESLIDFGRLENACRDYLNKVAPRYMGVLRPLKVTIENWDEHKVDLLDAVNNPEDPSAGSRKVPFTREIYIEQDDFMEDPPKKFYRLSVGKEVRLRWAYFLTCTGIEKDASGKVIGLRATIDPATRGGDSPDGRKVKATIHWVSAEQGVDAEVRLFDRLFKAEEPGKATGKWEDDINSDSLEVLTAKVEPAAAHLAVGTSIQFERMGYFIVDQDARPGALVFNRTVTLKDTWTKESIRPVEFSFEVDDFQVQRLPGLRTAKVGTAFIKASELVKNLLLDDWLKVNPRVPNRNAKDVLTGHVVRGIRETLEGSPNDFAIKNQGLYLLVDKIGEHEKVRDGTRLRISLSDPESHGLCNGGHTYAAIREYAESVEDPKALDEAFVRLQIFEGIDPEKVSVMAEGLNRSKQVDDPSLQNLKGLYENIKEEMKGKPGEIQIAYRQGDEGAYYITDIVRSLMFFNRERFDERRHPNNLYRQQKKMISTFEEDYRKNPSPFDLIVPYTYDILSLVDKIAKATPAAAKANKFTLGKMVDSESKRLGSASNKKTKLHFLDEEMNVKVPNGWLMVMLAAFRANVEWNLGKGRFSWRVPLDVLLPEVIEDLVRICVKEYRENKVKPDELARNASVYEQCYDKVKLALFERSNRTESI